MTDTASLDTLFPSYEVTRDPHPFYKMLRESAPVHQVPGRPEFIVSRHADITEALRRPDLFSSMSTITEDGVMRARRLDEVGQGQVTQPVMSDPPEHTRKRKLVATPFRGDRLRGYEPMVTEIADALIDQFADGGDVEFVSAYSARLPALVIMRMLGLPTEDLDHAILWSWYDGQGTRFQPEDQQVSIRTSLRDVAAYVRAAVIERFEAPRDDWLSEFVHSHIEIDGEFDVGNVVADTSNLIFGGMLTTNHMLGNMLYLLCTHAEQMRQIRDDRTLLIKAVEETLRYESPVQWVPRIARVDTELAGVPIPAGSILLMVLGAANRDAQEFDNADEFDIHRGNVKDHIAFGHHIHLCIGAPLSRLEGKVTLDRFLTRFSDIRFADPDTVSFNAKTMLFRGFESLHLRLEPIR